MFDDSKVTTSKDSSAKKPRKKSILKTKGNEYFDTSNPNWKILCRQIMFVIFACFSSITIFGKISYTAVVANALSNHMNNVFPKNHIEWICRLYPIVTLCLIPLTTSIIDHWMISYRISLVVSGTLQLIACVTSSTVTHPLFFVLTDALVCGLGSAITFSVFFLAIDDLFPKGNKFRVLTTTLGQGSTVLSLFVPGLMSYVVTNWGWMIFQLSLGTVFITEAIVLIMCCPEYGIGVTVKKRGGPKELKHVPELNPLTDQLSAASQATVSNRFLGLTFVEINRSPSMFPFLVYRFSMSVIHQGISMLVLLDSAIITNLNIGTLFSNETFPTTTAALAYASGETFLFLIGAIIGYFVLGYLLHISISMLCFLFLVSVIWQPIRLQVVSQSMTIGHIICAGLTGACIGGLDTCMTSLSEEGTMIPSRRVYPFVKLLDGLAYTFAPFLFNILNTVSDKNVWLLTFSLMSAANACLLVFILHKLYVSYRFGSVHHKAVIQASMKPVQFFSRKSESN